LALTLKNRSGSATRSTSNRFTMYYYTTFYRMIAWSNRSKPRQVRLGSWQSCSRRSRALISLFGSILRLKYRLYTLIYQSPADDHVRRCSVEWESGGIRRRELLKTPDAICVMQDRPWLDGLSDMKPRIRWRSWGGSRTGLQSTYEGYVSCSDPVWGPRYINIYI
jgi:hypothetical protein